MFALAAWLEKPQLESLRFIPQHETPEVINIFIRIAFLLEIKRNVEKSSRVYFIIRRTLLRISLYIARVKRTHPRGLRDTKRQVSFLSSYAAF